MECAGTEGTGPGLCYGPEPGLVGLQASACPDRTGRCSTAASLVGLHVQGCPGVMHDAGSCSVWWRGTHCLPVAEVQRERDSRWRLCPGL
ncbi:hypothetical protein GDO81_016914 [Engystomops pustulosus]|uniref:Uncharacterized protein n=1 Tax=Engystomops pustulosus TaxID=76066 RepID=A0AAV7AFV5_ENGPU|nr:hypothetical protein GDO81_016914 [Engystomops pustulosus]